MVSLDRSCVLITQQMIQIVLLRLKIFTAQIVCLRILQ